MSVEDNKRLVARAVAEVVNGGRLEVADELFAPQIAQAAKDWVSPFRAAFPEWPDRAGTGVTGTREGEFSRSGTRHARPALDRSSGVQDR